MLSRGLGVAAVFQGDMSPPDASPRLAPGLALIERLLLSVPPRVSPTRRNLLLARLAAVALLFGLLAVVPRRDTVEAPAMFQPPWQQIVSAPFDGVVEASLVQSGDTIEANETVLARLVTREIELEIASAGARAANELREAIVARAAGQPAQEQLALLSAKRAEAQVALLEHRLGAAELRSPQSGVLVSGVLRRSLGQPVQRGQALFEIAPPSAELVEIRVLDEDILRVRVGQKVHILPAAEPERPRDAMVERIRPVAEVVQQRNSFLVVARLAQSDTLLRPGSEGVAHIETGTTTWLASLLRKSLRYFRRLLWI